MLHTERLAVESPPLLEYKDGWVQALHYRGGAVAVHSDNVAGFLNKFSAIDEPSYSLEAIRDTLKAVRNPLRLKPHELEILSLGAMGHTLDETVEMIAALNPQTSLESKRAVVTGRRSLFTKLQAKNMAHAAQSAFDNHLLITTESVEVKTGLLDPDFVDSIGEMVFNATKEGLSTAQITQHYGISKYIIEQESHKIRSSFAVPNFAAAILLHNMAAPLDALSVPSPNLSSPMSLAS